MEETLRQHGVPVQASIVEEIAPEGVQTSPREGWGARPPADVRVEFLVLTGGPRSRHKRRSVALAALFLGAVAVPGVADTVAGRAERPQCRDPLPQELAPPAVTVQLEVSSTTIEAGEALRLKLTVRNDGPVPIPYTHGGQTHDFWIRNRRGVVWLWSQQAGAFTDIFVRDYLMPGETLVTRARWRRMCSRDATGTQPGLPGPGPYVARALWVSDVDDSDGDGHGSWWSNEVPFRIRPAKAG